jgi:hypothetical protein
MSNVSTIFIALCTGPFFIRNVGTYYSELALVVVGDIVTGSQSPDVLVMRPDLTKLLKILLALNDKLLPIRNQRVNDVHLNTLKENCHSRKATTSRRLERSISSSSSIYRDDPNGGKT